MHFNFVEHEYLILRVPHTLVCDRVAHPVLILVLDNIIICWGIIHAMRR